MSLEAITQATAIAKTNRALKTTTREAGQHTYKPGDLVDYHRPTSTKDDWGGWNGPFPIKENQPDRGQAIIRSGNRDIIVQYPDLRHTLYVDVLVVRELGSDNMAMRTVVTFIAGLAAGQPAITFGCIPDQRGNLRQAVGSKMHPKVHLALQYLIRNYFRIENVVAVRLAKSVHRLPQFPQADSCTLIHYDNDVTPGFHYYESNGTALNIRDITGGTKSRIIQCLKSSKPLAGFDEDLAKFQELADSGPSDGQRGNAREDEGQEPEATTNAPGGRLPTIREETEADLDLERGKRPPIVKD